VRIHTHTHTHTHTHSVCGIENIDHVFYFICFYLYNLKKCSSLWHQFASIFSSTCIVVFKWWIGGPAACCSQAPLWTPFPISTSGHWRSHEFITGPVSRTDVAISQKKQQQQQQQQQQHFSLAVTLWPWKPSHPTGNLTALTTAPRVSRGCHPRH